MDSSPTALPANLFEYSILNDDRNRWVSVGDCQHLFPVGQVVLRIELLECDSAFIVMFAGLRAIRTTRLRINFDFQSLSPVGVVSNTATSPASVTKRFIGAKL